MEELYDNFLVGGLEKLREFHRKNPDAPRNYRLTESYTPIHPGRMTEPKGLKHGQGVVGWKGGGLHSNKFSASRRAKVL